MDNLLLFLIVVGVLASIAWAVYGAIYYERVGPTPGILLMMLFFAVMIALGKSKEDKHHQQHFVDVSKCQVVGTAADENRNFTIYRTIYKCPNDTFHIR